jgi:hypothetical protein
MMKIGKLLPFAPLIILKCPLPSAVCRQPYANFNKITGRFPMKILMKTAKIIDTRDYIDYNYLSFPLGKITKTNRRIRCETP